MKTEHKYAQVLRWIADGEDVQARLPGSEISGEFESLIGNFNSWNYSDDWKQCLLSGDFGGHEWEFRLKPRTITVNGREIVAGETRQPPEDHYYLADPGAYEYWVQYRWTDHSCNLEHLSRGLVHLTKENAIAHAKAMLGID